MKQPGAKNEQAKVDLWNSEHPIGTPVVVQRDNGDRTETRTRSAAQLLSGHTAVVWLDGIAGCYILDRVTPRSVPA